jgi:Putative Flp pilus-assembly TadE/G-like
MRRVILHKSHEKGAVAIIVAILFGFGVMTAAAALTIDVGNINADRRQLQNGADAAALSAANDCANFVCPNPSPTTGSLAQQAQAKASYDLLGALANSNAADGATKLARVDGKLAVCGTAPGLSPCTAGTSTSNLQECPASALPSTIPYVRVYTQTLDKSGNTILPYSFGAAIAGAGTGANQQTCAAAAYGPAAAPGIVLPVTFSVCSWEAATGADPSTTPPTLGTYVPPPANGLQPGYGYSSPPNTEWPGAASELVLFNQGKGAPGDCTTWNNHVAPGTFGELTQSSCQATVVNNWVQATNGNPEPCDTATLATYKGKIVYIPIFDCYSPTLGSFVTCNSTSPSAWYHISGYAAFYLTGFYFSSGSKDGYSIFPPDGKNSLPCKNVGDRCVSGWFTTGTPETSIDTSGGPAFGSFNIQVAS